MLFGSNKYTGSAKSKGSPSGRLSGKILLVKSRPGEEEAVTKNKLLNNCANDLVSSGYQIKTARTEPSGF